MFFFLLAKHFEAEFVLNLFLIFGDFEARCSYKIVLIKKVYTNKSSLASGKIYEPPSLGENVLVLIKKMSVVFNLLLHKR